MIYYSDFELGELDPDLADTGFPANLCGTGVNCTVGPVEVGPEGSNSFDYQPALYHTQATTNIWASAMASSSLQSCREPHPKRCWRGA